MMPVNEISVALAVFNGEQYLGEQLASIANQSLIPDELMVQDDCSTDRTREIIEDFAKQAPFQVKYEVNGSRLGYAENFLAATNRCRGDIIAFCDQDDVWLPNKLKVACSYLQDPKIVMAVHKVIVTNSVLSAVGVHNNGIFKSGVSEPTSGDMMQCHFGFTLVFRRLLLDIIPSNFRPPDPLQCGKLFPHDKWVSGLAHLLGHVVQIDQPLAYYRQHRLQVTSAGFVDLEAAKMGVFANWKNFKNRGGGRLELEVSHWQGWMSALEIAQSNSLISETAITRAREIVALFMEAAVTRRSVVQRRWPHRTGALCMAAATGAYRARGKRFNVREFFKDVLE